MRKIAVTSGNPREIAVYEDGKLCEYLIDDAQSGAADQIILGKVVRVVSGMQAAFVEIGQEKNGFLPFKEASDTFMQSPLREGMRVPVQIKREAHGQKGAYLTRDVTLCGAYVILMPMNRFVGVSSRIESEELREELRAFGRALAQDCFGLVMRSSCAEAAPALIESEIEALLEQWRDTADRINFAPAPSVVYQPGTALDGVLRDYSPRGIDEIITDDASLAQKLCKQYTVANRAPLLCDIHAQRDKALNRLVWLKSGASLVIDQCEAMTVIDVNSGKFTGKKQLRDTLLATNLEACAEIARQLRLRAIGGIIVIDFIDMQTEEDREAILTALQEALQNDRAKTVVHGFTSLGLLEMTRRRTRPSLRETITSQCPACHGSGRRLTVKEEKHG